MADDLIQKDQAGREAALAQRPADIAEGELIRFLDGLPRRYLAVFDLDTIYGHVRLAARARRRRRAHHAPKTRRRLGLTVAALDSRICSRTSPACWRRSAWTSTAGRR
jgi:hypothetical protein